MLQVVGLEKRYGDRTLFRDVSFTLNRGERLAIVGRNGTGKSTLFKIILGIDSADEGQVTAPKGYTIGHLSQHLSFQEPTILQEACRGLPPGSEGEEYKAEIILSGLGFSESDFELPASSFSGGFQIRVELARVLLSEPNLLLLDEPTNYLDIVSARWLEEFLRDWPNEMMIISHDRTFLDKVSTHTMIIHRGGVRRVPGGTQKLYDIITQDEAVYEQTRQNQEKKRKELENFIAKNSARAATASLAQSRVKMLEKLEIGEELRDAPVLDFEFTNAPFFGKFLLESENLNFSYPARDKDHPSLQILKDFSLTISKGDRVAVIGKNGRGKSTLLKVLAGELKADSGTIRNSMHTALGYFGQTNIQRLSEKLTVEDEVTAVNPKLPRTKIRAICGTMMFPGDDALKKVKVLSGGERSRVLLGKMLAQPTNMLFLDEPTNHLDIESVAALVESIENYEGALVLVTHDEFMLRRLAKRIVLFSDSGVELIEGDYDYFLENWGWGDGGDNMSSATPKPTKSVQSNETEAQKAEKKKKLAPIEKEISVVENQIMKLEEQVKKHEATLLVESGTSAAGRLAEIGKSISVAKREIDVLFSQLEELSEKRLAMLATK